MKEIVRLSPEEASNELLKQTSVNLSLEGWPCAIAVVGLGIVYVIVTKIKYDSQISNIDSKRGKFVT